MTGVFEQLQHCADVAVETLDLEVVVEDVAAHGRCVRQERRHGYVFDAMSGLHTSAAFVRPVRILTAEPETERLAGRHALQKRRKILADRPCRIVLAPAELEITGTPALSFEADMITRLRQQVGINRKLVRPAAP